MKRKHNKQLDTQPYQQIYQAWQARSTNPTTRPLPELTDVLFGQDTTLKTRFLHYYNQFKTAPRALRRRLKMGLSTAALLCALNLMPARAATINVAGACTLVEAIQAANTDAPTANCPAGAGADTIVLAGGTFSYNAPNGVAALPDITSEITIEANGATIERTGGPGFRIIRIAGGGDLTLNSATISGGNVDRGGGIRSFGGTLTINDSTISGNTATVSGGGIYAQGGATITIDNSTISGNTSNGYGGGIFNTGSTIIINNSTISGNTTRNGGGIYNNGPLTLNNSTITANTATSGVFGAGGISQNGGTLTLNRSIVSGNTAPVNEDIELFNGIIVANNFNVLGDSSNTTVQALNTFVPGANDINATSDGTTPTAIGNILAGLANNGGNTQTHALVVGSPAVDLAPAADCAAPPINSFDQRRTVRPQGPACDAGAFERATTTIINPNQDIQIRNGDSLAAETITSNGVEVLSYGPFNRNQNVILNYLVRNPGAQVLDLGELVLPSFLSVAGDALPESLGSFESALLQVSADTSMAGTFTGQVSLASNDPDANENPFIFDLIVRVGNAPANALQVLPGTALNDITISPNQQNVPVFSARLLVPVGSADVTINSLTLTTDDIPALRDVNSLTLLIDGGTRGIQDNRDIVLATIDDPSAKGITFSFPERTLQPNLALHILVVADF
ncbi:MAG: right-handed parallel beta-helix repeat-containing protein [Deinococcota bacterium]